MAYSEELAARVRTSFDGHPGVTERKMFGGICFMIYGNMCCGVTSDDLMVRIGAENHEASIALPHARPMDFTGRTMRGMVYVGSQGIDNDDSLAEWIDRGVDFAESLPKK